MSSTTLAILSNSYIASATIFFEESANHDKKKLRERSDIKWKFVTATLPRNSLFFSWMCVKRYTTFLTELFSYRFL